MASKLTFLAVPEHKVFLVIPLTQKTSGSRFTVDDYRPMLAKNPIIATYAPITDLRGFSGFIGLNDLADVSKDFRAARLSQGHTPYLTVPQVIILDSLTPSTQLVDMVKAASKFPELVKSTFDPQEAWEMVALGAPMPRQVQRVLRVKRYQRLLDLLFSNRV